MDVKVDYSVLRKALESGTREIFGTEDFMEWAAKNQIDWEALDQIAVDISAVALKDMRDTERTLAEGLAGVFLSGFIGAFELLRPAIADETYAYIAQGKKVSVRLSEVHHID